METRRRATERQLPARLFRRLGRRWASCAAFALGLSALAPNVAAQTVQPINEATDIERAFEADGRRSTEYFYISREDCLNDDVFTFELEILSPNPQSSFQVWVSDGGADCTDPNNRDDDDALCWKVFQGTAEERFTDVEIQVQDIAARQLPDEIGGGVSTGTLESCNTIIETGITLYFMHVGGAVSGSIQGEHTTWDTQLDLQGPPPPNDVEAGIGDGRLVVSWELLSSAPGDARGFRIYCVESGDTPDVVDARYAQRQATLSSGGALGLGTGGSGMVGFSTGGQSSGTTGGIAGLAGASAVAGSGGMGGFSTAGQSSGTTGGMAGLAGASAIAGSGGTGLSTAPVTTATGTTPTTTSIVAPECDAPGLQEGALPDPMVRICGEVSSNQSDEGAATDLTNLQLYAVGVAAVDDLGNPGVLSNISCQAPEDLEEFFESYRAVGGGGGGGFCSIEPSRRGPLAPLGALLAAMALIASATARRRGLQGSPNATSRRRLANKEQRR